jgi:hypothetical protein
MKKFLAKEMSKRPKAIRPASKKLAIFAGFFDGLKWLIFLSTIFFLLD